jgi:5-methylcytosine-specific restriction endonuclease McrA
LCPICSGAVVQPATGRRRVYCSRQCNNRAKQERGWASGAVKRRGPRVPRQPVAPHEHTCTVCSAAFTSRARAAKYCSKLCSMRAATRAREESGRGVEQRRRRRAQQRAYENERRRSSAPWVPCSAGCGGVVRKTHGTRTRVCSTFCRAFVTHGRWARSAVPERHPSRSTMIPPDHPIRQSDCAHCDVAFVLEYGGQRYCTKRCADRAHRRRRDACKRAGRPLDPSERVVPARVFERDGWRCYLCGRLVKRGAVVPHLLAPTVDHVIPLSPRAGGGRDDMANARTAHFKCNSKKGDRGGGEQLALIG